MLNVENERLHKGIVPLELCHWSAVKLDGAIDLIREFTVIGCRQIDFPGADVGLTSHALSISRKILESTNDLPHVQRGPNQPGPAAGIGSPEAKPGIAPLALSFIDQVFQHGGFGTTDAVGQRSYPSVQILTQPEIDRLPLGHDYNVAGCYEVITTAEVD